MDTAMYVGPDAQPEKYRLIRSIGHGGEAVLYLAEVTLAGAVEPVVVKVLDATSAGGPEAFRELGSRWAEQAELLRFIGRMGVVGVREHFEGAVPHRAAPLSPPEGEAAATADGDATAPPPERALYLVMNHVDGLDLRDWRAERLSEGPRGRRQALAHLEQVAEVLDWLHSGRATPSGRTVVHGDLSPGNVMIDVNGQATLVDFGLSKISARHLTSRPWFTPGYAAPEVLSGEYTPATDRYAFGAVAYFLLSGEEPPQSPEQLRDAFATLPELERADGRQRERALAMFSTDPSERPSAVDWLRTIRAAATSGPWSAAAGTAGAAGAAGVGAAGAAGVGAASARTAGAANVPPVPPTPPTAPPHPPTAPGHPTPGAVVGTAGMAGAAAPPAPAPRRGRRALTVTAIAVACVVVAAGSAAVGALLGGGGDDGTGARGADGETVQPLDPPADDAAGPSASAPAAQPSPSASETGAGTGTETEPETDAPAESGTPSAGTDPGAPSPSPSTSADGGAAPSLGSDQMYLSIQDPVDSGRDHEAGRGTIDATEYERSVVANACYDRTWVEYYLRREWDTFSVTVGMSDYSPSGSEGTFSVIADGQEIAQEHAAIGEAVRISVPVRNVLRLRLAVECEDGDSMPVWGDPVLTR
ncbi:protein kinase domain-containing protein [Allostreptomyces psammosilenae]|uniref:non-specific serine/threonine protein kinase n=1 Tax=Allostreptomyces psammosilenae TaxID=1892865 RepID=A0A852ZZU2_9ACTN|nr:NPCBM/NEW2 domain-containing protein [Allostreptomyces psammosilenae]NYI07669.1 serine/threonine protein kinase [Allostreptomyces psammosilenae]